MTLSLKCEEMVAKCEVCNIEVHKLGKAAVITDIQKNILNVNKKFE